MECEYSELRYNTNGKHGCNRTVDNGQIKLPTSLGRDEANTWILYSSTLESTTARSTASIMFAEREPHRN